MRGQASDTLLDTYEQERKPVGARAVQRSLENWINHLTTSQVLGMTPDKTPEENWEIMRQLWSDEPQAQQARLHFENAIATQAMEFYEQNVEYGYTYNSSAIVPDGTPAPQLIDDVHVYEPSTRPGSTLPHAWLHRLGQRKALCDLAGHGQFLLITGEGGEGWIQAAAHIAQERGSATARQSASIPSPVTGLIPASTGYASVKSLQRGRCWYGPTAISRGALSARVRIHEQR